MQVFEELLLDADYSINAGNWMWLSASAFFHHYTRIFCPVRFGKRTDPEGQYIRYGDAQRLLHEQFPGSNLVCLKCTPLGSEQWFYLTHKETEAQRSKRHTHGCTGDD